MKQLIILLTLIILSIPAYADDDTLFNVVQLHAEAEQEIPNDQMTVVLATEHEGGDAANLARLVNQDMQWALDIIRQKSDVDSKTMNYQTYPVYNKQQIIGWRASQSVEIRSKNPEGLSKLTGQLQSKLQVRQMFFSPTDETRSRFENQLIEQALEAFNTRVLIIKKHMADMDHRIVNININTGGHRPPVIYADTRKQAMGMESVPVVEAGTSKITVTVSGSVQFF